MTAAPLTDPDMKPLLYLIALLSMVACTSDDYVERRQYGQHLVCHEGKETLAVSTGDLFVHEQHGDALGPCPDEG